MIDIVNGINHYQGAFYDVDNNALLQSRRENIIHDNEQNKIAQQAATELAGAINSLDIHEDYRYKKAELLNVLDNTINTTLQDYAGNLRYGVNQLMQMSRDIMTSPEITGLVETNKQYKQWKAGIQARNDISDDIKEMTISKNPYNFELIYKKDGNGVEILDEEGNKEITGYKDWVPTTYPVKQMNLNDIATTGLRYLTASTTGTYGVTYYDQNGDIMNKDNFNPFNVSSYKTSTTDTTTLTKADVIKALNTAFDAEPNMRASIMQDYEVEVWKYNQIKNSGDIEAINNFKKLSPFIDDNGNPIDPKTYVNTIFNDIAETYSFTNKTSRGSFISPSGDNGGGGDNTTRPTSPINQGYIKTTGGGNVVVEQKEEINKYQPVQ